MRIRETSICRAYVDASVKYLRIRIEDYQNVIKCHRRLLGSPNTGNLFGFGLGFLNDGNVVLSVVFPSFVILGRGFTPPYPDDRI